MSNQLSGEFLSMRGFFCGKLILLDSDPGRVVDLTLYLTIRGDDHDVGIGRKHVDEGSIIGVANLRTKKQEKCVNKVEPKGC